MHPIPICGFSQNVINLAEHTWVSQYWPVPPAHITGEDNGSIFSFLTHCNSYHGRAKNVTGIMESSFNSITDLNGFPVSYRFKQGE